MRRMISTGSAKVFASTPGAAGALPASFPDHELATELKHHQGDGRSRWHVITNAFSIRVFSTLVGQNEWDEVGMGDLGSETQDQLRVAAKAKRLTWENVDSSNLEEVTPELSSPTFQSVSQLDAWIKHRDKVTTGRQGEISDSAKVEV